MSQTTSQFQNSKQTFQSVGGPFRADQVGSLLRSESIKKARLQKAAGIITGEQLRAIENEEIKRIVEKQKELGLKAVTDGEFRRAWWHFDFLENLVGVEGYDTETGIQFHQKQTKSHAIKVTSKLDFANHPMLEDYKFLHSIAGEHTAKMTIPSPSMLHFRGEIGEDAYRDKQEFFHDLALTYKKAIKAFYEAGCRYLQLDDTSWAYLCSDEQREQLKAKGMDPDELSAFYLQTINEAVAERPSDMKITMHICRGNFRSTYITSGGYDKISDAIFANLNVDGLFLEYDDNRSGDFEPLKSFKDGKTVVLGLVTSKFPELEDPEKIKARIKEASESIPLENLALSPQCGFASTEEGNVLTEEDQWNKIKHIVKIAKDVWGTL